MGIVGFVMMRVLLWKIYVNIVRYYLNIAPSQVDIDGLYESSVTTSEQCSDHVEYFFVNNYCI